MSSSADENAPVANGSWLEMQDRRALARLDEELARKREPRGRNWAIVLAGGEGSRLRRLTTDGSGASTPKQFCSLRGGPSLLNEALRRAESLAPRRRICAVVAAQHERWWREPLSVLPLSNVLVQPENRGTALGILFALLHILEHDDLARVLILPADHHVNDEPALSTAMAQAVVHVRKEPAAVVLLGMAPEEPDPELGYILPALGGDDRFAPVARFIEKPTAAEARTLLSRGALWNSFIVAAHAPTLLGMISRYDPALVAQMRTAIRTARAHAALASLYPTLPGVDFCRQILQGRELLLRVLRVPACGWSDLGTVERVSRSLLDGAARVEPRRPRPVTNGTLSLERQLAHLSGP